MHPYFSDKNESRKAHRLHWVENGFLPLLNAVKSARRSIAQNSEPTATKRHVWRNSLSAVLSVFNFAIDALMRIVPNMLLKFSGQRRTRAEHKQKQKTNLAQGYENEFLSSGVLEFWVSLIIMETWFSVRAMLSWHLQCVQLLINVQGTMMAVNIHSKKYLVENNN